MICHAECRDPISAHISSMDHSYRYAVSVGLATSQDLRFGNMFDHRRALPQRGTQGTGFREVGRACASECRLPPAVPQLSVFTSPEKSKKKAGPDLGSGLPTSDGGSYGVTLLMRVDQLPSAPRVPPQVGSSRYVAYVQVCATYSDAIQIELPSTAAAP